MRRVGTYAIALDATVEKLRDLEFKRGLKAGATMETPKIDKLLKDGWDLTVSRRNDGRFHASVHLGRRHGTDSHHCIAGSVDESIKRLEAYIDTPESPVSEP